VPHIVSSAVPAAIVRIVRAISTLGITGLLLLSAKSEAATTRRTFDESDGSVDPRTRQMPSRHRLRLTIHSDYVRLSKAKDTDTGLTKRFHYAPLMLDLGYQIQFLRYMMFRSALAAGYNVANSRYSMPFAIEPQIYLGIQSKIFGLAGGYAYLLPIPMLKDAYDGRSQSIGAPIIANNHILRAELSVTSKVDRMALTFAFGLGATKSTLRHFSTTERKWRPAFSFQAGFFFDGTIRRLSRSKRTTNRRVDRSQAMGASSQASVSPGASLM